MASNVLKKRKRASRDFPRYLTRAASARLAKHGNRKSIAASKFMSIVPDDVLFEIFLRLPNARSVLRSAAVCKRWYSLILSPKFSFRRRFIEYHHLLKPSFDSSYLPIHTFAFLFKFSYPQSDPFFYLPHRSKLEPKQYDLSFIPSSTRLATRASSGDLMLLSEGYRRYYVCNSLTKRWFLLPEIPLAGDFTHSFTHPVGPFKGAPGFALVRYPSNTNQPFLGKYRVVVLCWSDFMFDAFRCSVAIFDSETGLWTQSYPFIPYRLLRHTGCRIIHPDIAIASNGVLYWLDGDNGNYHGMASLDPSTVELCLIPLPGDFQGIQGIEFKYKVQIGVVRGRVRVSRMVKSESKDRFRLRVWELDCGDKTWELVHDVELEAAGASYLAVLAFDPNDGDAVFVLRKGKIFRYKIDRQKFFLVCRFPHDGMCPKMLKVMVHRFLEVLPLVHPLWPTSLPPLRCRTNFCSSKSFI